MPLLPHVSHDALSGCEASFRADRSDRVAMGLTVLEGEETGHTASFKSHDCCSKGLGCEGSADAGLIAFKARIRWSRHSKVSCIHR